MKKIFICLTIIFTLLFSISAFAYDRTTIGSISAGDGSTPFYHDIWDNLAQNIPGSKNELLVVRFTTTEYYGNKESTHYLFYGSSLLPNETYPDRAIEIDYNNYSLVESAGVLGLSSNIRTTINPNVSVGVEDSKWNAMFRTDLVQQGHYFYDSSSTQYNLTSLICDYYIDLGSKSFNEGMNYASTLKATNYSALASHYVKGQIFDPNTNTFVKNVKYDLPVPDNVRCESTDSINTLGDALSIPFYLKWDIPESMQDLDFYSDIHTEVKIKEYFNVRKTISPWNSKEIESPWMLFNYLSISKHSLKYDNGWLKDNHLTTLEQIVDAALGTTNAQGTIINDKYPDFLVRFVYIDSNSVAHYSNYVLVQCHSDGVTIKEMSGKDLDDTLDKDDTAPVDKLIEDDTLQNEEISVEIDVDSDMTSFSKALREFVSGLGDFPQLFNSIFGFLPRFVISLIAIVITVIVIMRILGR